MLKLKYEISNFSKKMFNTISDFLKNYENKKSIKFHNQKIFKRNKIVGKKTKVSLIELTSSPSNNIANSYFSNYFSTEYKIKVIAYDLNYSNKFFSNLFFYLKKTFNVGDFGIYRSFGTYDFFKIKLKKNHINKSSQHLNSFFKRIKSKNDFLKLRINDVLLGDLIYDTYLRVNNKFTIKLDDPTFISFVKKMVAVFFFWEDYFKIYKVVSINVSHTVYQNAIPLRIAIRNKIPSYQLNFSHAFYLTNHNLFAYKDFIYYKNEFKKIPVEIKNRGKLLAKNKIDLRLKGRVGVDMVYSTKSAFHQNLVKSNIKKSSKFKILIAAHCFYDNPHPYGNNVFPDIYEWINFLGKFSEKTNYDWYIKSHTDFIPETRDKLLSITRKYKKFNLLPHNISHHQIKAEGIDVALTCWGTIGFEYALLGIPIINASQNNPHINYNFNIHTKTLKEYEKILLNIKNIKLKMNKNEIYEFYFMKNIFYSTNLFVKDFDDFVRKIGGYNSLFNSSFYNSWINEWSKEKHLDLIKLFKDFFKSRKYRLKI